MLIPNKNQLRHLSIVFVLVFACCLIVFLYVVYYSRVKIERPTLSLTCSNTKRIEQRNITRNWNVTTTYLLCLSKWIKTLSILDKCWYTFWHIYISIRTQWEGHCLSSNIWFYLFHYFKSSKFHLAINANT